MSREPLAQLHTYPGQDREQRDPYDYKFMAVPYFCHDTILAPAEPVEPLPILLLNTPCAPVANPNAQLVWYDKGESSEQAGAPDAVYDQQGCVGEGRWVAGGAPVQGRRKTPKPFAKGEIIDLTNEVDDDDESVIHSATSPPVQEPKIFRRTYTLDDNTIHLIKELPSPKSRQNMITNDIMSEVNPGIVRQIIAEGSWDRLSVPPRQPSFVPGVSPFVPDDRPKYALSDMHPRRSSARNMLSAEERLDRYFDAVAEGDPYAEKALAQIYAAPDQNYALPQQLGKRRRGEEVVEEQSGAVRRLRVYRYDDTDAEALLAKKPMFGSHRTNEKVGLKTIAKMAIGTLVHGYTSKPAGLFVKPRSKNENHVLPQQLGKRRREEEVVEELDVGAQRIHVHRYDDRDAEAPPAKKQLLQSHRDPDTGKVGLRAKSKMAISNLVHGYMSKPAGPFVKSKSKIPKTPIQAARPASDLRGDNESAGLETSQLIPPNSPSNSPYVPNIDAPILPKTPSPDIAPYVPHLRWNPSMNALEVYHIAAPVPHQPSLPRKKKHSQRPTITGRIQKPTQAPSSSKNLNTMNSKINQPETSKRISASLEQHLQDSADDTCAWAQPSMFELGTSTEDTKDKKGKKVKTKKSKTSSITDSVRRSGRIRKSVPANIDGKI